MAWVDVFHIGLFAIGFYVAYQCGKDEKCLEGKNPCKK